MRVGDHVKLWRQDIGDWEGGWRVKSVRKDCVDLWSGTIIHYSVNKRYVERDRMNVQSKLEDSELH